MSRAPARLVWGMLGMLMGISNSGMAKEMAVQPLRGKEWQALAMVTGFHALSNRKLGLAMRVLEADGSASVAENPVSLFLIVTNQGTSDLEDRIWRLPIRVAQVRKVTAIPCGLEIAAEREGGGEPGTMGKRSPATIKACFLNDKGKLNPTLRLEIAEIPLIPEQAGTGSPGKPVREH